MIQLSLTFHPPELSRQHWYLFERSAFRISERDSLCLRLHNPLILSSISVTKAEEWSLFVTLMFICLVGAIGECRILPSSWAPTMLEWPRFYSVLLLLVPKPNQAPVLFFLSTPCLSFLSFLYSVWRWEHFILWIVRGGRIFLLHRTRKICFINGIMSMAFVYLFWGS